MSSLTDADREAARRVVAAMPPWSDEALAELARIADSAPRPIPRMERRSHNSETAP